MSIQLIKQYQRELSQIRQMGATNELALKRPFSNLLYQYCQKKNLILVEEQSIKSALGTNIRPDGVVKGLNRMDWGYWESKDETDDLEEEIKKKFAKGYPNDNILFEDSQYAVLYQEGRKVAEAPMQAEAEELDKLLTAFVNFERPEYKAFRQAIEDFKNDLPPIIKALRELMEKETQQNQQFKKAFFQFFDICKESINPFITQDDIREMIVQHILTEDIFTTIFDEADFHHQNNIARELETVINTFFKKDVKRNFLQQVRFYYEAVRNAGARIADTREKQNFLKVIYEDFYKAYNPKGADRLGIVYTPNEIVRFMIESTDHLLYEHFGKELLSKGVEILDPATGTGTYITDLLDYFPASKTQQITDKYKNEIHANEVSILPYYIANLNIEFAFQQKTGKYTEFENLCFVDTLDNMGFGYKDKQMSMFGVSAENTERIKRQNQRKISVIIGNPPYNANQQNENDNNKNREYPEIDKRIKNTYIKYSTAQKTKVYDMYARFYRWATDRLGDEGIIAFVTNRSFIDSKTFDGFRKDIKDTFDFVYIVDTRSDVRANPKIAGTTHNVFGIQTGVAIMILVKKKVKNKDCRIEYFTLKDEQRKEEKLAWFKENKFSQIPFELISPDVKHNWINLTDNDFESLIPVCDKEVKAGKTQEAIFELFSNGVVTARDEWVYDFDKENLEKKVKYLIGKYNLDVEKLKNIKKEDLKDNVDYDIKWTRAVINDLSKGKVYSFDDTKIVESLYRPFTKQYLYFSKELNEMQYLLPKIFPNNISLCFRCVSAEHVVTLVSQDIFDYAYLKIGNGGTFGLPLYRYENGERKENITNWALELFQEHYKNLSGFDKITKEDIFAYVYAVLHNPAYRQKYEQNLKRDFPRIPLYENFSQWATWGKALMELHIHYETVEPYPLQIVEGIGKIGILPKAKLKAKKDIGEIELTEICTLKGVPQEAWEYKLGNRSALEWILDQYKESKPSDPTIAEKFNTYKFAYYQEQVIDLLKRVCTVSIKTMEIIREMEHSS
ncbi:MAG: type ISP restriction/modification enzyme [Thermonemataceae bacterium]|nr:type ISP restriction/modification enzyme [Thermonemataceae bacterium]